MFMVAVSNEIVDALAIYVKLDNFRFVFSTAI